MSKSTGEKAVIALVLGAAIGYAAGILTAPKSGKETRKDIKVAANKVKKSAFEKYEHVRTDLNGAIADAKIKAKDLSDKGRKELDLLIEKGKVAQGKAGDVFSAVKQGAADDKDLDKAVHEAKKAKDHLVKYLKNS